MVTVVRASSSHQALLLGCGMLNSPNRSMAICPIKLPPGTCFCPKLLIQSATRWEGELEFKESQKCLSCTLSRYQDWCEGARMLHPRGQGAKAAPRLFLSTQHPSRVLQSLEIPPQDTGPDQRLLFPHPLILVSLRQLEMGVVPFWGYPSSAPSMGMPGLGCCFSHSHDSEGERSWGGLGW